MPALFFILILVCAPALADDAVFGKWAGGTSILSVSSNGNTLSARIVALMDPRYAKDEAFGPVGALRRDDNNPDETQRARPLLGLELLSDYTFDGKRWAGKIYDPESGNIYSSRMQVNGDGDLHMRGYVGIPLLGRTAVFMALNSCTESMQLMLTRSKHSTDECAAE